MSDFDYVEYEERASAPVAFLPPQVLAVLAAAAEQFGAGVARGFGEEMGRAIGSAILGALGLGRGGQSSLTKADLEALLRQYFDQLKDFIRGEFQYQRVTSAKNAMDEANAALVNFAATKDNAFWEQAVNRATAAEAISMRMVQEESPYYLPVYAIAALQRIVILGANKDTFGSREQIEVLLNQVQTFIRFIEEVLDRILKKIEADTPNVTAGAYTGGEYTSPAYCGASYGFYAFWVSPTRGRICGFPQGIGANLRSDEVIAQLAELRADYLREAKAVVRAVPDEVLAALRVIAENLRRLLGGR